MHRLTCRCGLSGTQILFILCMSMVLWAQSSLADKTLDSTIEAKQKLIEDQAREIDKISAELSNWEARKPIRSAELTDRNIHQVEVDQAALLLETRKVKQESIGLDIIAAEQSRKELEMSIQELNERLQTLASTSEKESIAKTERIIKDQRTLLELEKQYIDQLTYRKQLAKEHYNQAVQWLEELSEAFQQQQESILQQSFEELQLQVSEKRQALEEQATALRVQLNQLKDDPLVPQADRDLLETRLLETEESIFLGSNQLTTTQISIQFDKLDALEAEATSDLRTIKASAQRLEQLKSQLDAIDALLHSKLSLLLQRQEVINKRYDLDTKNRHDYKKILDIFTRLIDAFRSHISDLQSLSQQIAQRRTEIDSAYLEQKTKGLTERHRLPWSYEAWEPLIKESYASPGLLLQVMRNTLLSLLAAWEQADITRYTLLILFSLVWSTFCLSLARLKRISQPTPEGDFTHKASFVVANLLLKNRFGLLLSGLLIITAWSLEIVPPGLAVISSLAGIWLGARFTIGLSHWILQSPMGLPESQPALHRVIVVYAVLISLFSLGLTMGHLGFLSQELTDIEDRAFMLLLLPSAYLAMRIRTLLLELFKNSQGVSYWIRVLGMIGFAIPVLILASALLGVSGFINLGWSVAGHLGLFLLVMTGWLIARGLVIDLTKTVKHLLMEHSKHSAFWIKGLVDPLHFIVRLLLLLVAIWILYRVFRGDPVTGLDLRSWFDYSLFTIGQTSITVRNLLGSLFLLVLVFYTGRWAREVTYGWLYGSIKDLGIRNSLSVFTQYTVVVIGLLIALNILGIDLTSLTVFAGALGVGIGFGLQNIANNFISGLILLAERPVRSRDWVTIGDKEGEVSQIGMRSVTVTTWDNQDVIIPNSDLVSNAFINWTRSNNVVRTVLFIGVHYQTDPHQAQQVIEEAVTMNPAVSLTPPPRVWLHEFGTSSVDFRVHYYMDVKQFSRLEVKSQVMFAIWDALREAGIEIPYPQQDVYIKEVPGSTSEPVKSLAATPTGPAQSPTKPEDQQAGQT